MKAKLIWTLVILVVVAIFGGRAWYLYQHKETGDNVVKIGAILDLSGPSARHGQAHAEALALAQKTINSDSKYGFKIQLLVEDSKFAAKHAISTYNKLKSQNIDGLIVFGTVPALTLMPFISDDEIPTIIIQASDSDLPKASPWAFRFWTPIPFQQEKLAKFVKNSLKTDEVAIISIKNPFGDDASKWFTEYFNKLGGKVIATEKYRDTDIDTKPQVIKILSKEPKTIVLFGFTQGYISVINTLKNYGYKGNIVTMHDGLSDSDKCIDNASGLYFASLPFDLKKDKVLEEKLSNVKDETVVIRDSLGYGSLMLFAEGIKNSDKTKQSIRDELSKMNHFDFIIGETGFNEDGEIILPEFVIKQMQRDGTAKVIKE